MSEILQSVDEEEKTHPPKETSDTEHGLPMFLSEGVDKAHQADAEPEKRNGFADLIFAARNKQIEYEPEVRLRPPAVRTSNGPLVVVLVVLLVIALAILERQGIIHAWPASARFFRALGLN